MPTATGGENSDETYENDVDPRGHDKKLDLFKKAQSHMEKQAQQFAKNAEEAAEAEDGREETVSSSSEEEERDEEDVAAAPL